MREYYKVLKTFDLKKINIESGKVQITDPCYEPSLWCSHTREIKKGEYICKAVMVNAGAWGRRIAELTINHISTPKKKATTLMCCAGVDSGQCGFFDAEYYKKYHKAEYVDDDAESLSWYRRVCDITLADKSCGTIDKKGVVSSSGFGDGVYDCYVGHNTSGEVTAMRLKFI